MSSPSNSPLGSNRVRIVVATSVMLTFISYWRAAAIVLNDLGSSAFYACGIAEQAVGKVRAMVIVGCHAVLVHGPRRLRGKLLDVRARRRLSCCQRSSRRHPRQAQRLRPDVRLHPDRADLRRFRRTVHRRPDQRDHGHRRRPWLDPARRSQHFPRHAAGDVNTTSVLFALAVTIYYWWENIKGIHESSEKALWVMQITTVMVVLLLGWSRFTLFKVGIPACRRCPTPANFHFSQESLGFLRHSFPSSLPQNSAFSAS